MKDTYHQMVTWTFIVASVTLGWGCAAQRKNFDQLRNLTVSDIVNHEVLEVLGVKTVKPPDKHYEPALKKFLDEFLADAQRHQVVVDPQRIERLREIKYVDQLSKNGGPGVVATCNRYFLRSKTVSGNKAQRWTTIEVLRGDAADFVENEEVRLRMLLYHELFHCLMGRGHLPEDLPAGIMSETLSKGSAANYEKIWPKMVEDMFAYADYCPVLED